MKIQILIDNKESWFTSYIFKLISQIKDEFTKDVILIHSHEDVTKGDILFLLSCQKIFKNLHLNKKNIVVHASRLPEGKGWSPVTWQVLNDINKIPVTLFEASEKIDSGEIYLTDFIELDGYELIDKIRYFQAEVVFRMIIKFLKKYPNIKGYSQKGKSSYYKKRTKVDSELNIEGKLKDQFNLLRVCDNEKYPAFFYMNKKKYILKVYEDK